MNIREAGLAALCLLAAAPACADPVSGYVHADGTVAVPSSLYTVTHTRQGRYAIKFTNPMEPSASCVITPAGAEMTVLRLAETNTRCYVTLGGGTHPFDSDFSFIAVPMSN